MRTLINHLRHNAVAYVALVLAMGGTSYAAATLPKDSVGTRQLQNAAVTGQKVRAHSLLAQDFKLGQLPSGAKGDTGPAGPQGPTGNTGAAGPQGPRGNTGPAGSPGPKGDSGPAGQQGPAGPKGDAGPAGPAGADGKTVLNGTGAPSANQGSNGDFYIDSQANAIYGPKTDAGWGNPTSLVGPQGLKGDAGAIGPQGARGNTGAQGPQGPQGPAGPPGSAPAGTITGYRVITANDQIQTQVGHTAYEQLFASCPACTRLLGGGAYADSESVTLTSSSPAVSSTGQTGDIWEAVWIVRGDAATGGTIPVRAYAYCANVGF